MSKDRPVFIIAFAADQQGCGWHRIQVPLASLVDAGVADGRIDVQLWPVEAAVAAKPDAIIWQRQLEDGQIAAMKAYREALPDTLFIYELDDYLGEIPKASFHAGFMPPDLPAKITRALEYCDRVTTSTETLAEWLRSLGGKDVRVVGNALPVARLIPRDRPTNAKLRIGFAGGISHKGDIELLRPAMAAIGDQVDWVFMGMQMKNPPTPIIFKEGVSPIQYLDELAKLNIDLMLAPLEDNMFNRCKSNLRLLETATLGAAVIAQDYVPYREGAPPVFAHATTAEDWTDAIRKFIAASPVQRKHSADALRTWVTKNHTLEGRVKDRLAAWTQGETAWRPHQAMKSVESVVAACGTAPGEASPALRNLRWKPTLVEACQVAAGLGADVLWLRPNTRINKGSWDTLRVALIEDSATASAIPLATDGPNAFPKREGWTAMSDAAVDAISDTVAETLRGRLLSQPATTGPCILLSKNALGMGGFPDVDGCDGNEEVAILEWGLRLSLRGWRHVQAVSAFACSLQQPVTPTPAVGQRFQVRAYMTNVQVPSEELNPADRATIECRLLRKQWGGLRPGVGGFSGSYDDWKMLRDVTAPQPDFFLHDIKQSLGFVEYGSEILPETDWIIFTDNTIQLAHNKMWRMWQAIHAAASHVDIIYADHDTRVGQQHYPEFKGDLDVAMLLARDYITPVCAVRRTALANTTIGSKTDLYKFAVKRALHADYFDNRGTITHVPEVLGTLDGVMQPEMAGLDAVSRQFALQELLGDSATITPHKMLLGCMVVRRRWEPVFDSAPKISIIVPTLGDGRLIQPCVKTILQHTAYPNFEVLVVQNGARPEPDLGDALSDPRVRVLHWEVPETGFNWSQINNWAAKNHAEGEYLVFMNDDVCVASMDGDWLDLLLGQATYRNVGVVGARLVHPAGIVQHVGVVVHKGIAGHLHKGLPNGHPGTNGLALLSHDTNAVTGACMLVSKSVFNRLDGFDESFAFNYNDTDFCMRARELGLRNIVEMGAELLHPEGSTRDNASTASGLLQLQNDNAKFAARWPQEDPYWSPHMALGVMQGGVMIHGLNADQLAWDDIIPPAEAERVLLINDTPGAHGFAIIEAISGRVPMLADASGFTLQLIAPVPLNIGAWDIRNPAVIATTLRTLGITRIVLRSLVGGNGAVPPIELLNCLEDIGIPVEVRPVTHEAVAPWKDENWTPGSAPFGRVDVQGWKDALAKFPVHWLNTDDVLEAAA